jgi:hypothetical protein
LQSQQGKTDFPIFGEVADSNPQIFSEYVLTHQTPSVLDFGFQKNISSFVRFGTSGNGLAEFFNSDDLTPQQQQVPTGLQLS